MIFKEVPHIEWGGMLSLYESNQAVEKALIIILYKCIYNTVPLEYLPLLGILGTVLSLKLLSS